MFWILYLISIADGVKYTLGAIGWIAGSIYVVLLIICGCGIEVNDYIDNNRKEAWKKVFLKNVKKYWIIAISFIFISISVFVPSSKNLIIIFGITKFTQSEIFYQTNETAKKSIMLLNKKLDKYLEDADKNED